MNTETHCPFCKSSAEEATLTYSLYRCGTKYWFNGDFSKGYDCRYKSLEDEVEQLKKRIYELEAEEVRSSKQITEMDIEIQHLLDKIADMEANDHANRRELRKPR